MSSATAPAGDGVKCCLGPAQEALQTARRKELYEILHPETANGGTGGGRNQLRQFGEAADRFTADTSERTGRSERAVQRDAERDRKLGDDLKRVAGTSLDKGVELDAMEWDGVHYVSCGVWWRTWE